MFRLTCAQINTTVPEMQRKFDRRMLATLLEKYDGVGQIRKDGLIDYIAMTRTRAQSLGFVTEQHILDIVEACILNGGKLWSNPFFNTIVTAKLMTQ